MNGKRYDKNNKKNYNVKKIIILLIYFVCIITMIVSGIKIIKWFIENKSNKEIVEEIANTVSVEENVEDIEKYNVDFARLKGKNGDTVGWIKVNGTSIEYPVVKTDNNNYYLTHSFDKTNNGAGWVFLDYKNKLDGTDKNIVIYAHNRKDGSMFGTLKNIFTKNWQENIKNYVIPFITEDEKAEYQVFSIYRIEVEDYYITTNFYNDSDFEKFIEKIKLRSVKDFEIEVNVDDKILTLSTCADSNKYRVVLHAKKIEND